MEAAEELEFVTVPPLPASPPGSSAWPFRSSVAAVNGDAADPRAVVFPACSVPAVMIVPPESVFAPASRIAPATNY